MYIFILFNFLYIYILLYINICILFLFFPVYFSFIFSPTHLPVTSLLYKLYFTGDITFFYIYTVMIPVSSHPLQHLLYSMTTKAIPPTVTALPLCHGNNKRAAGQLQPKCTALLSCNFVAGDIAKLAVPDPDTLLSLAFPGCPIFIRPLSVAASTITGGRDYNKPLSQRCAAQRLVAVTVTVCIYYW